jgi:hypothetical protein
MKKLLAILCAAAMIPVLILPARAAPVTSLSSATLDDAIDILKHVVGLHELPFERWQMLNFSGGSLSVNDAIIILKRLVGLDSGGEDVEFRVVAYDLLGNYHGRGIYVARCLSEFNEIIVNDMVSFKCVCGSFGINSCGYCGITIEQPGIDESFFENQAIIVIYCYFLEWGPRRLVNTIVKNDGDITVNMFTKMQMASGRTPSNFRTIVSIDRVQLDDLNGVYRKNEIIYNYDECQNADGCWLCQFYPYEVVNWVNEWAKNHGLVNY